MACAGATPTLNSATFIFDSQGCTVTVNASVDIPCGSSGWSLSVYEDPGSMATFGTQIDTVAMPYGPTTFGYSKVFSLQCKDPGPYTFSVRVECPGGYTGGSMSQTIN